MAWRNGWAGPARWIGSTLQQLRARTDAPGPLTRDCIDPWVYLEVTASGQLLPCCNQSAMAQLTPTGGIDRNSDQFQALRQALLSGDLPNACSQCHIRKTVPAAALQRKLGKAMRKAGQADQLAALPLKHLRIDITTKCNLRCDYCAVSSPTYKGTEMDLAMFRRLEPLLRQAGKKLNVHVNGHGETTYHPDWLAMCQDIIAMGYRPNIITNLAKSFTPAEIDMLAHFKTVQVSLDSGDVELMRQIRKAVRPDQVFDVIRRIRAAADRQGIMRPDISFSIGLYDPSIWTLEAFIATLLELQIQSITFWNLVEKDHQKLARALTRLAGDEQQRARRIIANVKATLDARKIPHDFAGDFSDGVGGTFLAAPTAAAA